MKTSNTSIISAACCLLWLLAANSALADWQGNPSANPWSTSNWTVTQTSFGAVDQNLGWEFKNVTGGPPATAPFGASLTFNVTFQALACTNSSVDFTGVTKIANQTSTVNGHVINALGDSTASGEAAAIAAAGGQVIGSAGNVQDLNAGGLAATQFYSDYQDATFGPFDLPKASDVKSGTTTYGQSPTVPVSTVLTLYWTASAQANGGTAGTRGVSGVINGNWSIALTPAPESGKKVSISAIAHPHEKYKAWFQESQPSVIGVTVP